MASYMEACICMRHWKHKPNSLESPSQCLLSFYGDIFREKCLSPMSHNVCNIVIGSCRSITHAYAFVACLGCIDTKDPTKNRPRCYISKHYIYGWLVGIAVWHGFVVWNFLEVFFILLSVNLTEKFRKFVPFERFKLLLRILLLCCKLILPSDSS